MPKLLLAAIGTVAIFSLVFRENKLYRLFEHLFLGLATGYSLATTWTQVLRGKWWDPMIGQGYWIWIMHCVQFDAAQHPVVRRRRRGSGLRLPFGHSGAPSEIAERDRDVGDAGGDSRRFAGLWRQQWRRLHGARLTVHHAGELYHHRNRHVRHAHRGGDGFSYSAVRQGPIRG